MILVEVTLFLCCVRVRDQNTEHISSQQDLRRYFWPHLVCEVAQIESEVDRGILEGIDRQFKSALRKVSSEVQ